MEYLLKLAKASQTIISKPTATTDDLKMDNQK